MHPRVHPKLADLCSIRLVRLESGIPIRRMPNAECPTQALPENSDGHGMGTVSGSSICDSHRLRIGFWKAHPVDLESMAATLTSIARISVTVEE